MKKKVPKSRASPENSDSDTENTPCLYWEGLPPPPPVCIGKAVFWTRMKDGLRVLYVTNGLTAAVLLWRMKTKRLLLFASFVNNKMLLLMHTLSCP